MTDRKRTRAQERAYIEMLLQLSENQMWATQAKLKDNQIPADWRRMDELAPVTPRKEKVTTLLDADLLRWFRGLGRGYQARINAVLRAYMLAVTSKEIETRTDRDWKNDPL